MIFWKGDRVILRAMEDNPRETGTVVAYEGDGLYLVEVDNKYKGPDDPDGLREVLDKYLRLLQ